MFNGPNQRRGSVVDRIRNFSIASLNAGSDNFSFAGSSSEHMADPYLHHGTQQTSFLGRKFSSALVPASARKASLAVAERQRDPVGMRMGETDGIAEEEFKDTFYNARLVLDGGSDEEMDEKLGTVKLDKGKGRGDWTATLGWEAAPPIGRCQTMEGSGEHEAETSRETRYETAGYGSRRVQRPRSERSHSTHPFSRHFPESFSHITPILPARHYRP